MVSKSVVRNRYQTITHYKTKVYCSIIVIMMMMMMMMQIKRQEVINSVKTKACLLRPKTAKLGPLASKMQSQVLAWSQIQILHDESNSIGESTSRYINKAIKQLQQECYGVHLRCSRRSKSKQRRFKTAAYNKLRHSKICTAQFNFLEAKTISVCGVTRFRISFLILC